MTVGKDKGNKEEIEILLSHLRKVILEQRHLRAGPGGYVGTGPSGKGDDRCHGHMAEVWMLCYRSEHIR